MAEVPETRHFWLFVVDSSDCEHCWNHCFFPHAWKQHVYKRPAIKTSHSPLPQLRGSPAVYIPFTPGSRCWSKQEVVGLYMGELRVLGNPSNVSVCPPGEAARGSDAARPAPAQNPPAHPGTVAVTTASGFVPSASPWGCQGTPAGFLHLWCLHSPCSLPLSIHQAALLCRRKKKTALLHPSLTLLCMALQSHSRTPASVLVESLHLPCSF